MEEGRETPPPPRWLCTLTALENDDFVDGTKHQRVSSRPTGAPPLSHCQISASAARSQLFIKMRQRGTTDLQGKDLLLPLATTAQMLRLAAFGFDPFFFSPRKERNLDNGKIKTLFYHFILSCRSRSNHHDSPSISPRPCTHTHTHPPAVPSSERLPL